MPRNPNLLFVFTDEQAARTMAAYGNNHIYTPHMDALAAKAVVFENAYVTQPVCTPSRSSLLTGLYPHANGCIQNNARLNPDVPCFPALADYREYKKGYIGKWHLGDEIFRQHGFDEWVSIDDDYRQYYTSQRDNTLHSTYYHFLLEKGYKPDCEEEDGFVSFSRHFCARQLPEEHTKAAFVADESVRFIRENKDRPFILFTNFFEPHMPFFGPRDNQYPPEKIPLPENFLHQLDHRNPLKTRLFKAKYANIYKTEEEWQNLIARYWGLVSMVDTQLGKMTDALRECGLEDNTIVVYTSDHGDMMGSHQLAAKCTMFEEAARVPLLLRIPWLSPAVRTVSAPVSQIDLVPTLLDAMGQPVPAHLHGHSWMPLLEYGEPLVQDHVFMEWNGFNGGFGDVLDGTPLHKEWIAMAGEKAVWDALGDPVRSVIAPDRWKYNQSTIGEDELYNLNEDPYEVNNLVGDERYAVRIEQLREKIRAWQIETQDGKSVHRPFRPDRV